MELFIDSANLKEISRLIDLYPIDGVTTNPSILAKEKSPFFSITKEILRMIGKEKMLHVQTIAQSCHEIVKEALYLAEQLNGNIYVKIPVIPEGLKAMKFLKNEGLKITATAVITPQQALLAAKAEVDYIAPYVNRISNLSIDGVQVVEQITKILNVHQFNTKVLGASFKNVDQINQVCLTGAHAITASPEMIDAMQSHLLTDWSVAQFTADWKVTFGEEIDSLIKLDSEGRVT